MSLEIDENGNINLKMILIGDSGVGKTSLINVIYTGKFNEQEKITTTASYVNKEIEVDEKIFNLYLWDTIGQEKMRSITKLFFTDSKIVILVYDITNRVSFESLEFWLSQVKETLDENKIVIGVCGNKSDLFEKEEINENKGREFAEKINAVYAYTSAKSNKPGFLLFLKSLISEYMKKNDKSNDKKKLGMENNKKIVITKRKGSDAKKKNKCC